MALEVVGRGQKITVYRDPLWVPGRKQATITLHDQHFDAGDGVFDKPVVEAYNALTTDAGGYTSGADQMRHALKVDDTGNRLWLPRRNVDSQSIRFARPKYSLDPLGPTPNWTDIPLGAPSRQGGLVKWTRPLYEIGAWITWRKIGLGWRILDRLGSDIVGLQIPVTLTGLQFDADTFQLKSAGLVLATVNVSDAVDATGKAFPVARRINGGAIEYTMDLTGAVYPVTVTPLNDTLSLQPDATDGIDVYNESWNPTTNRGTNVELWINANPSFESQSYLRFDLSSLAGATISAVNQYLYCSSVRASTGTATYARILAANGGWTEAGLTWNTIDGTNPWAGDTGGDGGSDAGGTVGGTDYSSTALGTFTHTNNDPVDTEYNSSLDLTEFGALVAGNYGIVLYTADTTGWRFRSSDYATDPTKRPKLVVVYTTGGGVTVTPTAVSAVVANLGPSVVRGSISLSPTAIATVAANVAPTVQLGSISLTPTPVSAVAVSLNPAVYPIPPAAASSVAASVDPTVILGSITITPVAVSTIGANVDPTVIRGSLIIQPDPVALLGGVVAPSVVLGSVALSPAAVSAVAANLGPTVIEGVESGSGSGRLAILRRFPPVGRFYYRLKRSRHEVAI